ncbi:MAG: hypothetical protein J6331_04910 [Lentisphaeria bacterium]|nr:hypothetical protein [Lentisphaeria bacterium]
MYMRPAFIANPFRSACLPARRKMRFFSHIREEKRTWEAQNAFFSSEKNIFFLENRPFYTIVPTGGPLSGGDPHDMRGAPERARKKQRERK